MSANGYLVSGVSVALASLSRACIVQKNVRVLSPCLFIKSGYQAGCHAYFLLEHRARSLTGLSYASVTSPLRGKTVAVRISFTVPVVFSCKHFFTASTTKRTLLGTLCTEGLLDFRHKSRPLQKVSLSWMEPVEPKLNRFLA